MKSIRITKLNTSTYKDIEYWDDGQESLDSIIYKFDSNLDSNNTRLAVGNYSNFGCLIKNDKID